MKNDLSSWLALVACVAVASCGGSTVTSRAGGDGGVSRDGGGSKDGSGSKDGAAKHDSGPAPGTVVGDCSPTGGCPAGSACYFPIGSCSAKAECVENPAPGTPGCGAEEELCGCDGSMVISGCGFPSGFASGPTTGASFCSGDAGKAAPDGGHKPDSGGPATACPASPPAVGAPCDLTYECEYGTDPDVDCDTVYSCAADDAGKAAHTWFVSTKPLATGCSTTNAAACPASYADLGATCSSSGLTCTYPQARCSCSLACGMEEGENLAWCCPDAPEGDGCPSPRPRLGTACTGASDDCDYGMCSGNVGESCGDAGVWAPVVQFGCPG